MRIAVVGAGYVGLVTGATFAYLGNQVSLLDISPERVDAINAGRTPIFEAHLPEILADLVSRGHLTATLDPASCIPAADVIFIAVSTPPKETGEADMTAVKSASMTLGRFLGTDHGSVVVTKSTVPIGSANAVRLWIEDGVAERTTDEPAPVFAVASNPEFLREGQAVFDSFYPDRIVWGVDDAWAGEILDELYHPLVHQSFTPPSGLPRPAGLSHVRVYQADRVSVEMIKYAANAFLATKISFANEMAAISERVGADVTRVMDGIGMDTRIGRGFLNAGIGYGGSCFGKDLAALVHTAREYGYEPRVIESTRRVNHDQREAVIQKLLGALKTLKGRRIAVLGLSFKPGTDDLRDAPSETIIRVLLRREARVIAYDPVAMPQARRQWTDLEVRYAGSAEDALSGADAAVLVTEWPDFLGLDWPRVAGTMARPLILDGRNALDPEALRQAGFDYIGIGR